MFEKRKYMQKYMKLNNAWRKDSDTLAKDIASMILLFSDTAKEIKYLKRNKYVLCDTCLLALILAISIEREYDIENARKFEEDIIENIFKGIMALFSVEWEELNILQHNRVDYFEDILETGYDNFVEEAGYLFVYDVVNGYTPIYNEQSPMLLIDIDKQLQIEWETKMFFEVVGKCVRKILLREN